MLLGWSFFQGLIKPSYFYPFSWFPQKYPRVKEAMNCKHLKDETTQLSFSSKKLKCGWPTFSSKFLYESGTQARGTERQLSLLRMNVQEEAMQVPWVPPRRCCRTSHKAISDTHREEYISFQAHSAVWARAARSRVSGAAHRCHPNEGLHTLISSLPEQKNIFNCF